MFICFILLSDATPLLDFHTNRQTFCPIQVSQLRPRNPASKPTTQDWISAPEVDGSSGRLWV